MLAIPTPVAGVAKSRNPSLDLKEDSANYAIYSGHSARVQLPVVGKKKVE